MAERRPTPAHRFPGKRPCLVEQLKMKVLIVAEDHSFVDLLQFALGRAGFEAPAVFDAPSALAQLARARPHVVLLDMDRGSWNDFDLLRELRRASPIPILLLSSRDNEEDKVCGLDLGADDYLVKPFSHHELVARIRARLRRAWDAGPNPPPTGAELRAGPLALDASEHTVCRDGVPLNLTATEYRLLYYLMIHANQVVPVRAISQVIWGHDDGSSADIVRVAVYRLRRKLEVNPARPQLVRTVPGVGIMLKAAA
jgi:DNA-binding response OmpR family regulator